MFSIWQRDRVDLPDLQAFHFARPSITGALDAALARRQHVLLYGPPRQGKTTLVRNALRARDSVTFHATDDTSFADIFRTFLLTLGASVTVEQRRKKKLGAKAEVSWKWPLFSAGGGVDAAAETEVTQRSFSADISNPNDVCYLLREFGSAPCLVIDHFEQLRRKQRRLMLEFLRISAEVGVLQVVLVATTLDFPLDYRERIPLLRSLATVEVPPLSRDESDRFVTEALRTLGRQSSAEAASLLFETLEGSVEATLGACALLASRPSGGGAAPALNRDELLRQIHEQTQAQFLALVAAVVEAGWTLDLARRVAHTESTAAWTPGATLPIADALARDPVFRQLHDAIVAAADERPEMGDSVVKPFDQAVALGKRLLATPTEAERVRLLAYAIGELVADPMEPVDKQYVPAMEETRERIDAGLLLCELLLEAPLDRKLELTAESLAARFAADGFEIVEPRHGNPPFERLARRLRRLQRRLGVSPPVFRVGDDDTCIVLWEPKNLVAFGDVKPRLKQLVDELRDEAGAD